MSKSHRFVPSDGRPCSWPLRRTPWPVLAVVILTTTAFVVAGCGKSPSPAAPETSAGTSPTTQQAPTGAAAPAPMETVKSDSADDFKLLEGRWLRGDGGYVVEIRRAQRDGKLEVAYFNPSPIRVAKAEAKMQGGLMQVFVELRDEGYPGCTYNLAYDAGHDCLAGTYFQAAMGETFPVVFVRRR